MFLGKKFGKYVRNVQCDDDRGLLAVVAQYPNEYFGSLQE